MLSPNFKERSFEDKNAYEKLGWKPIHNVRDILRYINEGAHFLSTKR
jgi:hypothetical protein